VRQRAPLVDALEWLNDDENPRVTLELAHDDTDQIHDETARQSRWALGIGLIIRI